MTSKNTTVYEDLEHRAHVLHRSDVYVGDTQVDDADEYVANKTDEFKISKKTIRTSAAILRIFIEVLSNAIDNFERSKKSKTPCTKIEVSINKDTGLTKVWNDGDVIPIEINSKNEYNHSMVFGRLLTSSNFNDEEDRVTSGRNGMGVKLANIFSKKFVVKGADPTNNKNFTQVWTGNMEHTTGPVVEDLSSKPKGFTEVSWVPDFAQFGIVGYTDDILSQYTRFVLDAAMLCPKVAIFLNGERIEFNSLKQYASLYSAPTHELLLVHKGPGIEVLVTTASQAESVSFINGVFTRDGGGHVEAWVQTIFKPLRDAVNALDPNKPKVKINDITRYFRIFVVGTAVRPRFSNQEKHFMTFPKAKDFPTTALKTTHLKTLMKWSVIDDIKFDIENKVNKQLKQSEGKKRAFVNVPNLTPANKAGGKDSAHCTLILCEGKSAKSYVMAGMEKGVYGRSGRDWFGVYPLRGKIKNCQDLPRSQICKIENVDDIIKALGLQHDADYSKNSDYNTLRYGRVMIMTDADVDGIHIEGLIINLFLCLFPTLFDRPESYIVSMKTPIVRISGPKIQKDILLFDERRYKEYALKNDRSTYKPQYYKGLGSSSIEEVPETFGVKMVHYTKDEKTSESIHRMFNKKRADARKLFLDSYDPTNGISLDDEAEIVIMPVTDFVDHEMPKHSMANNERMIPNLIDGLKTSQRKILFGAKLKKLRNKGDPIKVAQFGAYVSEHTSYHHGEDSLFGAIGNMASEFVGSNNIPLFTRNGQFGTRVKGGKDIAKPRYIRTKMDYLTQYIFPDADDILLEYLVDDGQDIEPRFYVPIIPMVLVNGGEGIGTGHACDVPAYNPVELVQAVKTWLDNDGEVLFEDPDSGDEVSLFPEIHPWYRGFTGRIEKNGTQYSSYGVCERGAKPNIAIVSELPVGMWTETFEIQLNEMQQGVDKTIQSVSDHNTVKKVWVEITELPDGLSCSVESLKLKKNIKVNMTLWGSDSKIHKYTNVDHIIDEFCRVRFDYYGKRRRSLIATLEAEIRHLGNKERFVREVVDNDLPLMKQKEVVVVQHLVDRGYDPSPEATGHGYAYLLRMQVSSLTEEKIKQLQNDIQSNQTKLDAVIACNEKQMWINDLNQFLKEYDTWLNMMSKEVATKPKVEKKTKKTNK
jgi:DNA topoisomerase-2